MKNLKKDLQAVNKEIKTLADKVARLIVAVDKYKKLKITKKVAAKKTSC